MGCGPWGRKELDRTEHLMLSLSTFTLFMRLVGVCVGVFAGHVQEDGKSSQDFPAVNPSVDEVCCQCILSSP